MKVVGLCIALTVAAAGQQPIAFSHKIHVGAAKVKCLDCHTIRPPGDAAGLPPETLCIGCHLTVKKDSSEIQKLAEFAAQKKPISWVRVYRLPRQVYFSHKVHTIQAKVDCAECHGPVAERDVI